MKWVNYLHFIKTRFGIEKHQLTFLKLVFLYIKVMKQEPEYNSPRFRGTKKQVLYTYKIF